MFEKFITCNNDCQLSSVYLHITIPSFLMIITVLIGSLIKSKTTLFKYVLMLLLIFIVIVFLLYNLLKWSCGKHSKMLTYIIFFLILCPVIYSAYTSINEFDKTLLVLINKK
jgi:hypothetical protein